MHIKFTSSRIAIDSDFPTWKMNQETPELEKPHPCACFIPDKKTN